MMTLRPRVALAALGSLLLVGGCAQLRAANASAPVAMEGQLSATLREADREAASMRFGIADRLLVSFAEAHPGTSEAVETGFWRAVFKLDPLNQTATPREAAALLDVYLDNSLLQAHRGAALTLRRAAAALDRPPVTVVTTPANATSSAPARTDAAKPDAKPDDKARDEEVQRLRDELAKANAELERIKKRLSKPNP